MALDHDNPRGLAITILAAALYVNKSKAGPAGTLAPYTPTQAFDEAETVIAEAERRFGQIE